MVPYFRVRRYTWVLPTIECIDKGRAPQVLLVLAGRLCSGSAAVVRSQGLHLIKPLTGLRSKIELGHTTSFH